MAQYAANLRRGSVVETRSEADIDFINSAKKEIIVRTPRHGRRRSIVVLKVTEKPRNFPIGRLNVYNPLMKKHRGSLSLKSNLESIEED